MNRLRCIYKHRLIQALLALSVASLAVNLSVTKQYTHENVAIVDAPRISNAKSITSNLTNPILNVQPIINPADVAPLSSFSPWIQEYILFHKSSIIDGKLKDSSRYIIYQCKDGDIRCGGAGDRMMGIVKMLYLAICTSRVLLIDSAFPIPLDSVLNPAHIEWNATFPETNEVFDDLDLDAPFDLRPDIRGYRVGRTNGVKPPKKSFDGVWSKFFIENYLNGMANETNKMNWSSMARERTLAEAIHEAFWALFRFDPIVVARAQELKASASLVHPYVGLHMRTGDEHMGVVIERKMERVTNAENLLTCYNFIRAKYPNTFASAYLASDNADAKEMLSTRDSSIHSAKDFRPFHIDLLARNESGKHAKYQTADSSVLRGTIDTWAEILVLAESTFLILSRSMFSFAAYYIRDPRACSVYLDTCVLESTGKGKVVYYGEGIVGDLSLIINTKCIKGS